MKGNNFSHKLKYNEYLELIYKCLSHDTYIELIHIRIFHGEIIYVYANAHIIVVLVILRLEIVNSSYIGNVGFDSNYTLSQPRVTNG
jgi:hypothetical protein